MITVPLLGSRRRGLERRFAAGDGGGRGRESGLLGSGIDGVRGSGGGGGGGRQG